MVLIAAVLPPAGEQNRQQPRGARGRVGRFGLKRKLLGKEAGKNVMPPRCLFIKDRECFDNTYDFLKQFAFNNQKCCVPDPTRMYDCNCGTNDSYCVDCGKYLACEECKE